MSKGIYEFFLQIRFEFFVMMVKSPNGNGLLPKEPRPYFFFKFGMTQAFKR